MDNGNGQTQAIERRETDPEIARRKQLGGVLENPRTLTAMRAVLPRHLTPERMIKVAISATMRTPKLLECTPESFVLAIMQCAELGLEPGGTLGHAYLVPFKKNWKDKGGKFHSRMEVQMIPGYRGLIALARRSAELSTISAHCVHANDRYSVRFGDDEKIEHEPKLDGERGPIVGSYAIAKLRDGGIAREYLTLPELEKIRNSSKAADSGPWVDWTEEMARKSAIRRLAKLLPLSPEMAKALELDAAASGAASDGVSDALELAGKAAAEAAITLDGNGAAELDASKSRSETIAGKLADAREHARDVVDAPSTQSNGDSVMQSAEREPGSDDGDDEAEAFERHREAQRSAGEATPAPNGLRGVRR